MHIKSIWTEPEIIWVGGRGNCCGSMSVLLKLIIIIRVQVWKLNGRIAIFTKILVSLLFKKLQILLFGTEKSLFWNFADLLFWVCVLWLEYFSITIVHKNVINCITRKSFFCCVSKENVKPLISLHFSRTFLNSNS